MPSLEDVANQINARLNSINDHTAATATNTAIIHTDLQAGFVNLSQGLFAVLEQLRAANGLLDHLRRQNDTIICELANGNELLCGITRKFTVQLTASEATLRSVRRLEGILARVDAEAAGDYDREQALLAKVHECCPADEPPLEPCPEVCDEPGFDPRPPRGQDWQPLPGPDPIG